MKKAIETFLVLFCIICITINFSGCLATQVAGDFVRSGQKETDVVLAKGVTPAMLQQKRNIAVNINGVNSSGQYVASVGEGNTNAGIYSDMLTKEFLKMGYQSRTITESISESSGEEEFRDLEARGFDILLVGNMNLSMTTSVVGIMTGGEYANLGVTSFTIRGIDVQNGNILFILSTEYGKAKKASIVTKDLADLFKGVVMGGVASTEVDINPNVRSRESVPETDSENNEQKSKTIDVEAPVGIEDDIQWIQGSLNELGYDCGTADGVTGSTTRGCIREFQRENNLKATGKADRETAELIYYLLHG